MFMRKWDFMRVLVEFIIFIDFWVIVAVTHWGGFSYRLVKIFDTYPESSGLLRPLVVITVFSCIWGLLKRLYPKRTFLDIFKNPWYYLVGGLVVYNAIVIPVVLRQYYSFTMGNPHDFALHHQALFNTILGRPLRTDIFISCYPFVNWNLLKDHFFIFLLLAPFYYFFQEGSFLLIFQILAFSIASVPIYLLGKERLRDNWLGLLMAFAYLVYPPTIGLLFHGSRPEYYAIGLLLFSIYAIQKNRIFPAIILMLLAVLCKEEVYLATFSLGAYIFFFKKSCL